MSITDRGFTLTTMAQYVDGLEKRIALLEAAIAVKLVMSPLSPVIGARVENRGRWWYAFDAFGNELNDPGFKTREEAEALLAEMAEAKAKAA